MCNDYVISQIFLLHGLFLARKTKKWTLRVMDKSESFCSSLIMYSVGSHYKYPEVRNLRIRVQQLTVQRSV